MNLLKGLLRRTLIAVVVASLVAQARGADKLGFAIILDSQAAADVLPERAWRAQS